MQRRRFIKLGGLFSATATTSGVAMLADGAKAKQAPLAEFSEGGILTAAALNALVERINDIESRIS